MPATITTTVTSSQQVFCGEYQQAIVVNIIIFFFKLIHIMRVRRGLIFHRPLQYFPAA